MKRLLPAILVLALGTSAHAQGTATRASVDSLITFFGGRWSCEGKFANGSPIAADVTFEPVMDNKFLAYVHVDRAPGRFKMTSLWGLEASSKRLISAGADNGGALRIFRAPAFSSGELVFERAALGDSLARGERFTYRKESDDSFRMTYEIGVKSTWLIGDFIVCTRAH